MQPCITLYINTLKIWKMYNKKRKTKKENLKDIKLAQTWCQIGISKLELWCHWLDSKGVVGQDKNIAYNRNILRLQLGAHFWSWWETLKMGIATPTPLT
jgi:hypothetical protein